MSEEKRKYSRLNVWPDTKERVLALRRRKTHKTGWGEHTMESVDSVLNRLLEFYEKKMKEEE